MTETPGHSRWTDDPSESSTAGADVTGQDRLRAPGGGGTARAADRGVTAARDGAYLAAGTAVTAMSVALYAAIGGRTYGDDAFDPIAVIWTFWAVSNACLSFPIQHWVIRSIESNHGDESLVSSALGRIWAWTVAISLVLGGVGWIYRDSFFPDSTAEYLFLVATIPAGSTLIGLIRGSLAARGRFRSLGLAIAFENFARAAAGLVVVLLDGSVQFYGLALLAGYGIGLVYPPRFDRTEERSRERSEHRAEGGVSSASSGTDRPAGGLLVAVTAASTLRQLVRNGGPALLAAVQAGAGAPAELFQALSVFRSPFLLAQGVATRLTGWITLLVVQHRTAQLRKLIIGTLVAGVGLALIGFTGGAVLGKPVLKAIYGGDFDFTNVDFGLLGAGSLVSISSLVATLILTALDARRSIVFAWVCAFGVAVCWIALAPGDAVSRLVAAQFLAEVVAMLISLWLGNLRTSTASGYRPVRSAWWRP